MGITYSFFPKMLQRSALDELAGFIGDAGYDTCNAVVRPGYWVDPEDVPGTLPPFVRGMKERGYEIRFATTGWNVAELLERKDLGTILGAFAGEGVTDVRVTQTNSGGGFGKVGDVRSEIENLREDFARIAEAASRAGVRIVYQAHHKTLLASPSSLWQAARDLPPESFGVMLDGGNQAIEGYENWLKSSRLTASHLCAFGVKDAAWTRDPARLDESAKGWSVSFVPCYEGIMNWREIGEALADVSFSGTLVFMPFYKYDGMELKKICRIELEYVRERIGR